MACFFGFILQFSVMDFEAQHLEPRLPGTQGPLIFLPQGMWGAIAKYCLPFSCGQVVADLGAGDGTLGKLLEAPKGHKRALKELLKPSGGVD